ncbi:MAG: hypothetical protein ACRBDL_07665 [Alphaproteobacteria bacterium]
MMFTEVLPYERNGGFRTPPIAQPIRLLSDLLGGKDVMVEGAGFEPA